MSCHTDLCNIYKNDILEKLSNIPNYNIDEDEDINMLCIFHQNEILKQDKYTLFFDGACKNNGNLNNIGGAGAVIYKNGVEIWNDSIYLTNITNNISEYKGLLLGLQGAIDKKVKNLVVKGDSLLVIKQMRGEYKVKSDNIKQLHNDAKKLLQYFDKIEFQHIYRNENTRADDLSNYYL